MMSSKLVPKIRFKEFSGEWEKKEVGKIFQITRGEVLSMKLVSGRKNIDTPYPVYSSQTKNNGLAGYYSDYLFENAITWTTDGANAGDVNYRQEKFYCTNVCGVLINKDGYANQFIAELLNTVTKKHVSYVGNPKLMNGVMAKISIPIPPTLLEQQKIADTLSSLDNLIEAQTKKIELLKEHKKGLMQQLFPIDDEKIPKLRFKEFSGEWEETIIGNIGKFHYGKSAPKWSLGDNAPTKCVRYGELYTKFGVMITETYSRTNIEPEKLRFSKGGEILVPRVGERPEEFGKYCSYLPLKDIAIGEMISVFETKENPLFYTYYFRNLWLEFSKVVEGQNVKNLYYKELEPLKIYRPNQREQQKIANTLFSIDNLIEAQSKKIEILKEHKKGLMQQMFVSEELNK